MPVAPRLITSLFTALVLSLPFTMSVHAESLAPAATVVPETQQKYEITGEGALRRELAHGVYQVVYSPLTTSIYVASSEAMKNVHGGAIYQLDPKTLETTGLFHLDEKSFGLDINPAGDTLFVTHSLSSAVSKLDLKTGKVMARLKFTDTSEDGSPYGPRTVLYEPETDTVYVGGVGDPGMIWVIDAETFELQAKIPNAGKWVTGLLSDVGNNRLYAANGDGEVLVIDTSNNQIQHRWKPAGSDAALLLNLAHDASGHRLFVTDDSQLKMTLVLDDQTGRVIKRLPLGDSMDIKYQAADNALYVSHRGQGTVSILDADTYQVTNTYKLPPNPNSLLLVPDQEALYVTVKTPFTPEYTASGPGSVVRISLPVHPAN
ncbi:YncE family protein [Paenalcaligenes niemegkensis]|uniref:YncE family protein n=1 Tax=Paenalcaligenes niemegkensis TaxID=2895469 RepID=UPI001EE784D1|nr:YncE family protein [Paenalcaligenes niemegkensis]MCQ9618135.1 YncE family protein [Paenalcaligenes niemegkensis]